MKNLNPDTGTSIRYNHKNNHKPTVCLGNMFSIHEHVCVCKNLDLQLPYFSPTEEKSRVVKNIDIYSLRWTHCIMLLGIFNSFDVVISIWWARYQSHF